MTSQGKRVTGIVEAFDNLVLGYILRKLTEVFEELIEASKIRHPDNAAGAFDVGRLKAAKKIPVWLRRLKCSKSCQVTHVLIGQMNESQKSALGLRFEAQALLLEVLIEEALAMDVTSYSQVINQSSCSPR